MSIEGEDEEELPRSVPALTQAQEQIAFGKTQDDPAVNESLLFSRGDSADEIAKQAAKREADRAERFKDHFERVSIFALYFLSFVFCALTLAWGYHLVVKKEWQIIDENQEDKIQLIITGGFVAGLASSHLKKRIGGS